MHSHSPSRPIGLPHRGIFLLILAISTSLAVASLLQDSYTFDEPMHLTSGMSILRTGDFRISPDHPPLPKVWAALPLLFYELPWVPGDDPGWQQADGYLLSRRWLFGLNDGPRLLVPARLMMVAILAATVVLVYLVARRLFGPAAGLLAMALAALSPPFLAHGRLVTTDMPITFTATLALILFARLLEKVTWGRVAAAGVSVGLAALCKASWLLLIPVFVAMAAAAIVDRKPMIVLLPPLSLGAAAAAPGRSFARLSALAIVSGLMLLVVWATIWTGYGWRWELLGARPSVQSTGASPDHQAATQLIDEAWKQAIETLETRSGGLIPPSVLRLAYERRILPQSYILGLALVEKHASGRMSYFRGKVGTEGSLWYFPVTFLIKTPVPVLLLLLAGAAALLLGRTRCGDDRLLLGLLVWALVYFGASVASRFNLGLRHLLPVYPAAFALAGAASGWLAHRTGRRLVALALFWLCLGLAYIHPHYLGYFNELIGGPAKGHLYLADSNIDWGQDLKRLAKAAAGWRGETVKLAYFGSVPPEAYGITSSPLPGFFERHSLAHLDGGGTYVVSLSILLGIYDPYTDDAFWVDPGNRESFRELAAFASSPVLPDDTTVETSHKEEASRLYAQMRWGKFLRGLRQSAPNERVGWSLWVYRLGADEVRRLTDP